MLTELPYHKEQLQRVSKERKGTLLCDLTTGATMNLYLCFTDNLEISTRSYDGSHSKLTQVVDSPCVEPEDAC